MHHGFGPTPATDASARLMWYSFFCLISKLNTDNQVFLVRLAWLAICCGQISSPLLLKIGLIHSCLLPVSSIGSCSQLIMLALLI
jgi:hypothetical protein